MLIKELVADFKKYQSKLVKIFASRNVVYAGKQDGLGNFKRNAVYNKAFRLHKIINEPYGVSIHYSVQKIDRLVNELIQKQEGLSVSNHLLDHIDDAIVYLFITRMILIDLGIIDGGD